MNARFAALLAASFPAALAAEPWTQVAELPGGIALELDEASVSHGMDGERHVVLGTFRKQLPNALMETSVAVDCNADQAKIRRVRLLDGDRVMADNILATAEFLQVNEGSAEAFYTAGLCTPAATDATADQNAPADENEEAAPE